MRIFIGGGGEHFGGSSVDFEANNGGTYFVVKLTIETNAVITGTQGGI